MVTGVKYNVIQFVEPSAKELGLTLSFSGEGEAEMGTVSLMEPVNGEICVKYKVGDAVVRVDSNYNRPTKVETLLGDATNAKEKLGQSPSISLPESVSDMVAADFEAARRKNMVKLADLKAYNYNE